jgi:hypothetical protein
MVELMPALPPLLGLLLLFLLLAWLSRQVSLHVQLPFYTLTRSQDAPTLAIFLVFLPGVIIHEAAHWGMARLLGLRTGKFRVWPKRQGRYIGLGSVSVESRGPLLDSLVGGAPLLIGTLLITLIGHTVFDTQPMASALMLGDLAGALAAFQTAFAQPSALLWAYLLFTIANAMMPSASDREPLKPVLFWMVVAIVFYLLLGMPTQGAAAFLQWVTPAVYALNSALLFVILLDLIALSFLYVVHLFMRR